MFSILHTTRNTINLSYEWNSMNDISPGKDFSEDIESSRLEIKERRIIFHCLLILPILQAY